MSPGKNCIFRCMFGSFAILSKLSNILAKVLLGVPINDYTNGFRFYYKRAAKTLISKLQDIKSANKVTKTLSKNKITLTVRFPSPG